MHLLQSVQCFVLIPSTDALHTLHIYGYLLESIGSALWMRASRSCKTTWSIGSDAHSILYIISIAIDKAEKVMQMAIYQF